MAIDLAKIHESFQITSVNPVTLQGDGNFTQILEKVFANVQKRMTPVEGLPGVYTIRGQEQTLEGLQVTQLDV